MHIPDNYLSPSTCGIIGAVMIPVWTLTINKTKKEITDTKMPMLGIGAAFSFLIMMFNIPLPGGTTGHAVGGALLAILLGPWAACISISVALLIQALIFGDGGILAFGANSFNMAFVFPFISYYIYKFTKDWIKSKNGEYIGMALGAYFGIVMASFLTAIEFGIQPLLFKNAQGLPLYCPYPLVISIPAMVIPHLLVAGFIEIIFTVGIYSFIKKVSPGIIYEDKKQKNSFIYGLIILLICLSPLGIVATGTAWGEWGIEDIKDLVINSKSLGYVPEGMQKGISFQSIMSDYSVKGIPDFFGYILSAIAGVAILIIIFKVISSISKKDNDYLS